MIELTILMLVISAVFVLILLPSKKFVAKDRIDLIYSVDTDILFWYNLDRKEYGREFRTWKMTDSGLTLFNRNLGKHLIKIGEL